jgi:UDP-GlcNAc:undecaprenyl-phosphate/decaprenyl-phosphate GlcNAc-1-phosphate transferase
MKTLLAAFLIAFLTSLAATPLATKLGIWIGAVDRSNERKVHRGTIPRSGGLAIFLAFVLTLGLISFSGTKLAGLVRWDSKTMAFFGGAVLIFTVGFIDDLFRLRARVKLFSQILAATVAFVGGIQITTYYFTVVPTQSILISYVLTVFWFVLIINAINLIDGLDGLAGGIIFFVCSILLILLVWQKNLLPALYFAALGGAVLGFLRYNFNPASVFMGDGGSYFLGFAIAGLSIIGSSKAETGTALIIPLLAMGIPVFDTLLSPVRRFIMGQKLFKADKSHIHHRLVERGFSTRKAVLLIYAVSCTLCGFAIVVVNFQQRRAGLFLIIVTIAALAFSRKLGYFEYLAFDKLLGWFKELSDVSGLSHDRRSFFRLQIDISRSRTMEDLWQNVCSALESLRLDRATFCPAASVEGVWEDSGPYGGQERRIGECRMDLEKGSLQWETPGQNGETQVLCWARGYYRRKEDIEKEYIFKVKLPLMNGSPENIRALVLFKDIKREHLDDFTLRRIEQLRRTIVQTLNWLEREKKKTPEPAFALVKKSGKL